MGIFIVQEQYVVKFGQVFLTGISLLRLQLGQLRLNGESLHFGNRAWF